MSDVPCVGLLIPCEPIAVMFVQIYPHNKISVHFLLIISKLVECDSSMQ